MLASAQGNPQRFRRQASADRGLQFAKLENRGRHSESRDVDRTDTGRYVQALNIQRTRALSPASDRSELELMWLLDTRQQLSQREVAASLGISVGKVNYCLRALIRRGFVKVENYRNSNNKLAYLYLLTPSGVAAKAELTREFLVRKVREYDALRLEIERLKKESEAR